MPFPEAIACPSPGLLPPHRAVSWALARVLLSPGCVTATSTVYCSVHATTRHGSCWCRFTQESDFCAGAAAARMSRGILGTLWHLPEWCGYTWGGCLCVG